MTAASFKAGDKATSRDGHPVTIVRIQAEDGVDFAVVRYDDGHLPGPVGGRVAGTEDEPLWEHRVLDGKVVRSGGSYWNDEDWVVEQGLQPSERAVVLTVEDGATHELRENEKGFVVCPGCGHDDVAMWADDGEADLADWWQCEKFSGGCGSTGAVVYAHDTSRTLNGCSVEAS